MLCAQKAATSADKEQPVPTNYIFLAAVIVNLLIIIPLAFMLYAKKKGEREGDGAAAYAETLENGNEKKETGEEADGV